MARKTWNKILLLFLLSVGGVVAAERVPVQPRSFRQLRADEYNPGRILVIPMPGRAAELARFHANAGAKVRKEYLELGRVQVIELPVGANTMDFIEAYQSSGLFEVVEPDIRLRPAAVPNDPSFIDQWALNNIGQSLGVPDADIDAPEAWDRYNSASNVVVAVLDSGLRLGHQDLVANLWVNPAEIPGNGLDDDQNGYFDDVHGINSIVITAQPTDDLGHGTHVAGILGAVGNNGVGICGVAWRVRLMVCKFLSQTSGNSSDLVDCIDYARIHGANVLNCSFTTSTWSENLSNVFWGVRNAGIVVVAAAGNNGTDNDSVPAYPAGFKIDNLVAVTATTREDGFSGYNYGASSVHLGAPGSSILSTYNRSDNDYTHENGTSMAAPHVSGALALMRARYPQATPQQLISRLLANVDPLPSLVGRCSTGGRLNLDRALGPREFTLGAAPYAWIPTNGMNRIILDDDGVTGARPLPFTFNYYGQNFNQVYVSANGIVGFQSIALNQAFDADIPTGGNPNGALYAYWDDLNPAGGGEMWEGTVGLAPDRKYVVSWVNVPHTLTAGGVSLFTFQAVLHETGEISFQYREVQNGRSTLISGKSATIGIEDPLGQSAVRYAYHGLPSVVTNGQALVFSVQGSSLAGPSLKLSESEAGQVKIVAFSQPGRRIVLSTSTDAQNWMAIETNTVPASGIAESIRSLDGGNRFFRAALESPF